YFDIKHIPIFCTGPDSESAIKAAVRLECGDGFYSKAIEALKGAAQNHSSLLHTDGIDSAVRPDAAGRIKRQVRRPIVVEARDAAMRNVAISGEVASDIHRSDQRGLDVCRKVPAG